MGGVKQFAEDVSYALGLEGEITLDVKIFTERILQNIQRADSKAEYALESMLIAKDFRQKRDEISWLKVRDYLCRQGVA